MPERTHMIHLTGRSLWNAAREHGVYRMSTRGRLPAVAALLYGSHEAPEAGAEKFPHVYGPIPVDTVTWVEPWR